MNNSWGEFRSTFVWCGKVRGRPCFSHQWHEDSSSWLSDADPYNAKRDRYNQEFSLISYTYSHVAPCVLKVQLDDIEIIGAELRYLHKSGRIRRYAYGNLRVIGLIFGILHAEQNVATGGQTIPAGAIELHQLTVQGHRIVGVILSSNMFNRKISIVNIIAGVVLRKNIDALVIQSLCWIVNSWL